MSSFPPVLLWRGGTIYCNTLYSAPPFFFSVTRVWREREVAWQVCLSVWRCFYINLHEWLDNFLAMFVERDSCVTDFHTWKLSRSNNYFKNVCKKKNFKRSESDHSRTISYIFYLTFIIISLPVFFYFHFIFPTLSFLFFHLFLFFYFSLFFKYEFCLYVLFNVFLLFSTHISFIMAET